MILHGFHKDRILLDVSLSRNSEMKICLIHGRRVAREVLARALASRLNAEVDEFFCCENALATSLDYDVFVVYNNFRKKMNGFRGAAEIRGRKSQAFVLGVTSNPNLKGRFKSAGADVVLLRSGNEIAELVGIVYSNVRSILKAG